METKLSLLSRLATQMQSSCADWTGVRVIAIATLAVGGSLLGIRHFGGLESRELALYDQMVRWHHHGDPDPRFLVVGVTEADLRNQQQWPFSDATIAQLLKQLQAHQPTAIGLDVYRDIPVPPGHSALVEQLQKPNVITIRNVDPILGTPAPPASPPDQVGFNMLPIDRDNVVRRNLLISESPQGETLFSFSLRLAILYLGQQGITPQVAEEYAAEGYLQLGEAVFLPLQPDSGGYQTLDKKGYQILLRYRNSQQLAREISLTEALAGEFEPEWVKDKIVLIGSRAPSLEDRFLTPYSPTLSGDAKMPGVIAHGQLLSQLLDAATGQRPLFWFWPAHYEIAWLLVWTLLGGIVGWQLRHPIALFSGMGLGLLVLGGVGYGIFTASGWVPLAAPGLGFLITAGVVVTYQSYDDYRRQKIVMRLLGQNTSPEIAEALWRGRDHLLKAGRLPGVKLTATMLFLDIKGFSTVSEKMTPEQLLDWLNEILGEITTEVLSREGIVNKFTGDGVMAVFGVPLSRLHKEEVQRDAENAVVCALAISDRLEQINQRCLQQGLPTLQMRIGIFTGPVVVGSLGGKDRLEYGVLGDSVNTAARLESCEKHRQPVDCRILIAKETLMYLSERFLVESWGLIALKGKEHLVDVYRLLTKQDNVDNS
ncbi:adenylate/guanylate cyclase domain-containing protein [Spirulina sp. CS-785/01]|uniref:CHASE2 domain-containing protein n=1 Tax=Spirulina sp. CS-785/01 TaxID=3021716 RepID=UPI00232D5540|nr:adenylate/guanylate cyclase domain-containing protein [Spirulina sp. CS-785/01]MDB9315473.1 adenylate/guanylate cyclase domain-containing protein [Spirulina sp. CS-785/01]